MTVVHVLEPFATGVASAVISIAKQLPHIRHVVVHGERAGADGIAGVKGRFPPEVIFIPWPHAGREINPLRDFQALCSLLAILKPYKKNGPVIHLHSSKAGFLGRLSCAFLGIHTVVYTPHCAAFLRTDINPSKRRLFRFLERLGGWFGGTVAGCGEGEAALYRGLAKNVRCVSNGIDLGDPAGDKGAEAVLVSFSGLAGAQKDPALFNRIAAAFPEEPFCWIGAGPLEGLLSSPNIACTGWLDKAAVDGFLRKTLVYLSASAWEGLPMGALEAMAASSALLLRDVPGNRELVIPGENGYLFHDEKDGAEFLKRLLIDREKTLDMGKRSRALAEERYSAESMGRGYAALYAALSGGALP